jgi:hypothetical protein
MLATNQRQPDSWLATNQLEAATSQSLTSQEDCCALIPFKHSRERKKIFDDRRLGKAQRFQANDNNLHLALRARLV